MPPLVAITRALGPVAFSINAVANTILRLLHVEPKDEVNSVFTGDELSRMVKDAGDNELLDERRTELLQDTLELDRRPLSDVVTPTSDVVFAPPDTTPAQLERLLTDTGYSRFPILNADGSVTHYLHIKDGLRHDSARDQPPVVGPATDRPPLRTTSRSTMPSPQMRRPLPSHSRNGQQRHHHGHRHHGDTSNSSSAPAVVDRRSDINLPSQPERRGAHASATRWR